MKLLVVDDDPDFCSFVGDALSAAGYEVTSASDAHAAISAGLRMSAELLVTDWMLRDDVHGLHLSRVLQALHPSLRTVLITGFPGDELAQEARRVGVSALLSKPVRLDTLLRRVEEVASESPPPQPPYVTSVWAAQGSDAYQPVNAAAWAASPHTLTLAGLLGGAAQALADETWTPLTELAGGPFEGWARLTRRDDATIVVAVDLSPARAPADPLLRILFEGRTAAPERLPGIRRALLVDDERLVRLALTRQLERVLGLTYAAASGERALRMLRHDPDIDLVLLDYDIPGEDVGQVVQQVRRIRPEAVLVGHSGGPNRGRFAELGVDLYLQKPWRPTDLARLLEAERG